MLSKSGQFIVSCTRFRTTFRIYKKPSHIRQADQDYGSGSLFHLVIPTVQKSAVIPRDLLAWCSKYFCGCWRGRIQCFCALLPGLPIVWQPE